MGAKRHPGQKHSPYSPHSPRQDPGNGVPGNEGIGGKDNPRSDVVSSNGKRTASGAAIAPVIKWPTECLVQADRCVPIRGGGGRRTR